MIIPQVCCTMKLYLLLRLHLTISCIGYKKPYFPDVPKAPAFIENLPSLLHANTKWGPEIREEIKYYSRKIRLRQFCCTLSKKNLKLESPRFDAQWWAFQKCLHKYRKSLVWFARTENELLREMWEEAKYISRKKNFPQFCCTMINIPKVSALRQNLPSLHDANSKWAPETWE